MAVGTPRRVDAGVSVVAGQELGDHAVQAVDAAGLLGRLGGERVRRDGRKEGGGRRKVVNVVEHSAAAAVEHTPRVLHDVMMV